MANPVLVGTIANRPFETTGRSESWAEQRNISATVVGQVADISNRVKPGDSMAQYASWFNGAFDGKYFVKTTNISSDDGVTGTLQLALLYCPDGKKKPYNVTWDVSMEEVQMRLINHPMIIKNADVKKLLLWEDTPKGIRVTTDNSGKVTGYRYRTGEWSPGNGWQVKDIEGDWNIAYCKAVTQGIETYNRYLPVITKNSYYLELPGVDYSDAHVITGGTITDFTSSAVIGSFNEPEMKVVGYTSQEGVWFKNGDKFTSQADGTWVRTESWVFTNDPSHKWIYTNSLD